MSEAGALGARVEALEVRVAYQDQVIEDLNKLVTEQWKQIEGLTKQVERMQDRLQQAEDNARGAAPPDAPPPHY